MDFSLFPFPFHSLLEVRVETTSAERGKSTSLEKGGDGVISPDK